jgi:hypothetical protein
MLLPSFMVIRMYRSSSVISAIWSIPSDCQYSAVSGNPVYKGTEVQGQKEDGNQDKNHSQHPEDGGFGTLNEEL